MSLTRNKHVAALIAVIALGIGFVSPSASASASVSAGTPSVQSAACKKAKIGGKKKCIAAGQFCARKHERDYNKYGYTCSKRDKNGRYHLKKL